MDAIKAATEEIAKADQQIEALIKRRQELVSFLNMAKELLGLQATSLPKVLPLPPIAPAIQAGVLRTAVPAIQVAVVPRPLKDRVVEACLELLKDGFPMKPVAIVEALELRGIAIGGANKAMSLSSMLSKDRRFQPDRKWGWSLKRAPSPVAAGEGGNTNQGETPDADSSDDEL
ncbi:hypothetical protein [Xanthomonas cannabis]|uniref:hypothetical protein n=1 Tax=Xanthomonas cannabis TaxID=1885674 RepID=UPI00141BBB8F|nr:hypothetical protein [Xanthomonas cannabis]NIK19526.1 chorismate mutase [Xanthomonas cannabis]